MKRYLPILVLFFAVSCSSCNWLGSRAERNTLIPAMEQAWPAIQEDFDRGIADGVDDGDLTDVEANALALRGMAMGRALSGKEVKSLRAMDWFSMQIWVERGIQDKIDDGEIGPGVAESLREQLRLFSESIQELKD